MACAPGSTCSAKEGTSPAPSTEHARGRLQRTQRLHRSSVSVGAARPSALATTPPRDTSDTKMSSVLDSGPCSWRLSGVIASSCRCSSMTPVEGVWAYVACRPRSELHRSSDPSEFAQPRPPSLSCEGACALLLVLRSADLRTVSISSVLRLR